MKDSQGDPVEISTRMHSGEWSEETLADVVGAYRRKLQDMGAPESEIETEVDRAADGSVRMRVSWAHRGVHTFGEMTQAARARSGTDAYAGAAVPPAEGETSRPPEGESGDPEVPTINGPPTARAKEAAKHQRVPDAIIYTSGDGETYVEDPHGGQVRPKRHL